MPKHQPPQGEPPALCVLPHSGGRAGGDAAGAEQTSQPLAGRRALGRSGLRVGPLSFGASAIGNLYHAVDDDCAASAVIAALRAGVRYFDTAPHYGLGLSERRLGAALRAIPRDEVVISTKVGRLLVPRDRPLARDDEGFDVPGTEYRVRDYSRDGVLRSLESSLSRLDMDHVDVVLVHDPDDHYREALDGAFPALSELRDQGVIRSFGAGMNTPGMAADLIRHTDADVMLVAGRYTLLDQAAQDELLSACLAHGVSLVAAGVFNSGLLATDRPEQDAYHDYQPAPAALIERAHRIADVCGRYGVTLPQAAVWYPLRHPAIVTVCLGTRSAAQMERNAALFDRPPPPGLWAELSAEGLIPAG